MNWYKKAQHGESFMGGTTILNRMEKKYDEEEGPNDQRFQDALRYAQPCPQCKARTLVKKQMHNDILKCYDCGFEKFKA